MIILLFTISCKLVDIFKIFGLGWVRLGYIRLGWVRLDCLRLGWVRLRYLGLGWL